MSSLYDNLMLYTGESSLYLAKQIAERLGVCINRQTLVKFADGEMEPSLDEPVRGKEVYIVQSTFPSADNMMELLLLIDAAKRASAHKVCAIIPYYGYARQDRKAKPRVPIGAKLTANILQAAGADRVVTIDLHAAQIQGFFDIPFDHLQGSAIFIPYIEAMNLDNLIIGTPDVGGTKRAHAYSKYFATEMVICHKYREKANEVSKMNIIGDVVNKNVVLIDDIVDTGGTITKAANLIKEKGAKSVRVLISHPLLSDPATQRIEESQIDEFIILDTIPLRKPSDKITVLSCDQLIADTIHKIHTNQSISSNFIF